MSKNTSKIKVVVVFFLNDQALIAWFNSTRDGSKLMMTKIGRKILLESQWLAEKVREVEDWGPGLFNTQKGFFKKRVNLTRDIFTTKVCKSARFKVHSPPMQFKIQHVFYCFFIINSISFIIIIYSIDFIFIISSISFIIIINIIMVIKYEPDVSAELFVSRPGLSEHIPFIVTTNICVTSFLCRCNNKYLDITTNIWI